MVSFFAEVVATTGLTVGAVLAVVTAGVATGTFAIPADVPGCAVPAPLATTVFPAVGAAMADVVLATVEPGRPGVGAGFFEAIAPAAVEVATAGPGDVADAACATPAGAAPAHGSAVCALAGACPFL